MPSFFECTIAYLYFMPAMSGLNEIPRRHICYSQAGNVCGDRWKLRYPAKNWKKKSSRTCWSRSRKSANVADVGLPFVVIQNLFWFLCTRQAFPTFAFKVPHKFCETKYFRCKKDVTVCNRNHHTTIGNHMSYGITQCYLTPGSGDFPAFTTK